MDVIKSLSESFAVFVYVVLVSFFQFSSAVASALIYLLKSVVFTVFASPLGDYFLRLIQVSLDLASRLIGHLQPPQKNSIPAITSPLLLESATELVPKIKKGLVKSEDLVKEYIDRIKTVNPHINAVIDQQFAQAVLEAIEIDRKVLEELDGHREVNESVMNLPLLGIPFTCKDSMSVKGLLQTSGVVARDGVRATDDGQVNKLLRQAGAIPLAVTNVPEYIMWFNSYNKLFGRTLNPYDLSRNPGGSSGGEGALLASAGSVIGIGSDIAGSIRVPSMFCGIFGHKSTPGIASLDGNWPAPSKEFAQFAVYGPMTRYANDLRLIFKVIAGDNIFRLKMDEPVKMSDIKFYYQFENNDPLAKPVDREIKSAIKKVVEHMKKKHGSECLEVNYKDFRYSMVIWSYMLRAGRIPHFITWIFNKEKLVHWTFNLILEFVKYFLCLSHYTLQFLFMIAFEKLLPDLDSEYGQKHLEIGKQLQKDLKNLLGSDGVLFFPTHPTAANKHLTTGLKVINFEYTAIFNALGFPVTHCPLGLNSEGLPIGVQIVAAPYNDHLTIAVAQELETAFGGWKPPSQIVC